MFEYSKWRLHIHSAYFLYARYRTKRNGSHLKLILRRENLRISNSYEYAYLCLCEFGLVQAKKNLLAVLPTAHRQQIVIIIFFFFKLGEKKMICKRMIFRCTAEQSTHHTNTRAPVERSNFFDWIKWDNISGDIWIHFYLSIYIYTVYMACSSAQEYYLSNRARTFICTSVNILICKFNCDACTTVT